ncbi:phage holin family protein [Metasolibacillus meyeri]|uniref:Phage holin family protein n=1 Tax=Metasolibacillus meyeri TaxID=1071052 RepID=A0AAW9NNP3_9BACL|nr:phage holin family protein [Metasolibacillus meyeri]MEC1177605.1 phage holin family protein [Metasolibacillus meyeri]
MDFLYNYIIEQALIVVPVLLVIGQILKSTPKMSDWVIPYILLALGVLLTIALMGFNANAIIQGVLVAGAAVFANQLYKQYVQKDGDSK